MGRQRQMLEQARYLVNNRRAHQKVSEARKPERELDTSFYSLWPILNDWEVPCELDVGHFHNSHVMNT
jgi:hypothetical protein